MMVQATTFIIQLITAAMGHSTRELASAEMAYARVGKAQPAGLTAHYTLHGQKEDEQADGLTLQAIQLTL